MSVAAYRIRKAAQKQLDHYQPDDDWKHGYRAATEDIIAIIDAELEKEAERAFTQPINPQIG